MTDANMPPELSEPEFDRFFTEALKINGLEAFLSGEKVISDFYLLTNLLLDFNRYINITAIRDVKELVLAHYVDCLTVAPLIPERALVADIGCGGGFPTLPLAIVRPDISLFAIDSTRKKLFFVELAAEKLNLKNITPSCIRAEEAGREPLMREVFGFVTARAVAALPVLCELCLPCLKVGGTFCAMKGPRGEEELAASKNAIRTLGGEAPAQKRLSLLSPGGGEPLDRRLILIKKTAPTPSRYPRTFGSIKKKPL